MMAANSITSAGVEGIGNGGGGLDIGNLELDGAVGQHSHLAADLLHGQVPEAKVNASLPAVELNEKNRNHKDQ